MKTRIRKTQQTTHCTRRGRRKIERRETRCSDSVKFLPHSLDPTCFRLPFSSPFVFQIPGQNRRAKKRENSFFSHQRRTAHFADFPEKMQWKDDRVIQIPNCLSRIQSSRQGGLQQHLCNDGIKLWRNHRLRDEKANNSSEIFETLGKWAFQKAS